ncbi:unnamed protein product [Brassica oleracea var. botrytis]
MGTPDFSPGYILYVPLLDIYPLHNQRGSLDLQLPVFQIMGRTATSSVSAASHLDNSN